MFDISLSPEAASLISGLFGGAGATLLWEIVLKPKRERRNVAEVLSAEISHNIQMLGAAMNVARTDRIPPDVQFSTMVFDAVVEKIGELPPKVIGEVVLLYRYFQQLNSFPRIYSEALDRYRETPADAPHKPQLQKELQSVIDVYNSYLPKAAGRVNIVQPQLLKVAFPWWSPRRLFRSKAKELDLAESRERIEDSQQHRRAVSGMLGKRSSKG